MFSGTKFLASSMEGMLGFFRRSQRSGTKCVAGLHRALLIPGHEPLLSLCSRAMRKRVRHHATSGLPLQRVITNRRCGCQRRIDIASFQKTRPLLCFAIDPDPRQAVRLQLDLDLQRVSLSLAAGLLLQPSHTRQDAKQVLDVVPSLMRDDICRRELAGVARTTVKSRLDLAEKSGVEKNLPVRRTIERPHRRLRHPAAAPIGRVAKQYDPRTGIGLSAGLENFAPAIVDLAEDTGDHAPHLVGWRAGLGGPAIGLIARRPATTGENFRATDQDARIDPESISEKTEHDDGADAETAATHWKTKVAAATTESATVVTATVLDIVAATKIIVTHGGPSSLQLIGRAIAVPNAAGR